MKKFFVGVAFLLITLMTACGAVENDTQQNTDSVHIDVQEETATIVDLEGTEMLRAHEAIQMELLLAGNPFWDLTYVPNSTQTVREIITPEEVDIVTDFQMAFAGNAQIVYGSNRMRVTRYEDDADIPRDIFIFYVDEYENTFYLLTSIVITKYEFEAMREYLLDDLNIDGFAHMEQMFNSNILVEIGTSFSNVIFGKARDSIFHGIISDIYNTNSELSDFLSEFSYMWASMHPTELARVFTDVTGRISYISYLRKSVERFLTTSSNPHLTGYERIQQYIIASIDLTISIIGTTMPGFKSSLLIAGLNIVNRRMTNHFERVEAVSDFSLFGSCVEDCFARGHIECVCGDLTNMNLVLGICGMFPERDCDDPRCIVHVGRPLEQRRLNSQNILQHLRRRLFIS